MKPGKPIKLSGYTAAVRRVRAYYNANVEISPYLILGEYRFSLMSAKLTPNGGIEAVYGQ